MRPTPFIDSGPFDSAQACRAAGIDKNRLALWHHRANFQSEEDRAEARIPGDPRQYTGADCVRMRLLATLADSGVPIVEAQKAVSLFDRIGLEESWVCVLTLGDGGQFEARAVRPEDLQRVLWPASDKARPRLAVVVNLERIVDATILELSLIRAEQAAGRMRVMGYVPSAAEVSA